MIIMINKKHSYTINLVSRMTILWEQMQEYEWRLSTAKLSSVNVVGMENALPMFSEKQLHKLHEQPRSLRNPDFIVMVYYLKIIFS